MADLRRSWRIWTLAGALAVAKAAARLATPDPTATVGSAHHLGRDGGRVCRVGPQFRCVVGAWRRLLLRDLRPAQLAYPPRIRPHRVDRPAHVGAREAA